jgi:hypothetical protein
MFFEESEVFGHGFESNFKEVVLLWEFGDNETQFVSEFGAVIAHL